MDGQDHGEWSGFNGDKNKGTVITTMALNKYFNGQNRTYLSEFEAYIESQPNPLFLTDFTNKNLTSHIEGNKQVTDKTEVSGTDKKSLTFDLQEGVSIICDNRGWNSSGRVTVTNGDVIHFEAPLNITGKWTSKNIENSIIFQSILLSTGEDGYQRLAQGGDFIIDSGSTTSFSIQWSNLGNIQIHKVDSLTNKGIPDTSFKVTGNGIEKIIKTDSNGFANLEKVVPGTYKVVEIISNPNYYIDTKEKEIVVEAGKTKTLELSNKHTEGTLEVLKIDEQQNKKLQGVKFELYSEELARVVSQGVTDRNGVVRFTNLRTGNYKLYEVETSKWYRLDSTKHIIEIKKDETTYKTIKNKPKCGYIIINKYDKDFPELKLENAVFEIYNSSGNKVDTITTNSDGYAKSKALPLFDTYKLKEIKCQDEYVLDDREIEVKFKSDEDNQEININCENEHYSGKLKILKVNKINDITIEGVKFELFSKELNKVIAKGKTNKEGKLEFNNLRTGEYILYEVEANKWYQLDTTKLNVQIRKNETNNIKIRNSPKMGYIAITKNDANYKDIFLEAAKFQILDLEGNIVDTLITNNKGYAKSKGLPIYDTYIVKEIEAPKGYKINSKIIKTIIKENETTNLFIENEREPVESNENNHEAKKESPINNPKTGDDFSLYLMLSLLIISSIACVYIISHNILTKN